MADLSAFASAAAARSEMLTDPGSALAGIENGDGINISDRVLKSGNNTDGRWYRFSNGLQVCMKNIRVDGPASGASGTWVYPNSFSGSLNIGHAVNLIRSNQVGHNIDNRYKITSYQLSNYTSSSDMKYNFNLVQQTDSGFYIEFQLIAIGYK